MKKAYYLDLMEATLSAYTTEHIDRYFDQVNVCAESTLAAYKSLLRKGLITKRKRNDNQEEYIITEKGRNTIN